MEEELSEVVETTACDHAVSVSAACEPVSPYCESCKDFGVVGGFSGPAKWCDCEHASRRREREPNYVESYNARCAKTWSNAGGSRQLVSQRMTA